MKACPHCHAENPDQLFCGVCGSHLELKDYIADSIAKQIESRDRALVETDITFRALERVSGVLKNLAWIFGIVLAIVGLLGAWKFSDFWSSVNAAKQAVLDTSGTAKSTIEGTANRAVTQMQSDTATFKGDLANSRKELEEAKSLQPQMNDIRQQLQKALTEIKEQQSVISSSEQFVKSVFSSHKTDIYTVGHEPTTRLRTAPAVAGGRAVVLFLLTEAPIKETLQLQYRVFAQPPNSFSTIHNLVIFMWGEPLTNLDGQQLSASYFPDKSDKGVIKLLSEHDGRIFADNEPLPHFNQPDPDFKGNRWIEIKDGKMSAK